MKSVIAAADQALSLAAGDELAQVQRLSKDIKDAIYKVGVDEARWLVDTYYQLQHDRITSAARIRSMLKDDATEPHALMTWLFRQYETLENQIKLSLDKYSDNFDAGEWAKDQIGIGPVIAAGLIANINPEHCQHAASVWRYAGLAPHYDWAKGEKRPWNARLKTLCAYKMGESFVKTCNHPEAFYGKIYKQRKELETLRNDNLEFADQAKAKLEKFNIGKTTEAYKHYSIGKLPPAHIHARARRVAVKLFLSHFSQVYYETVIGKPASQIYAIKYLEHDDYITPIGYTPLVA